MAFQTVLWMAPRTPVRKALCTRLLVISGILLVAVQNPGSSISLDRLRRCWNGTSFCLVLILVASAVLAFLSKALNVELRSLDVACGAELV